MAARIRVTAEVHGLPEFEAEIEAMRRRINAAGRVIARDGLRLVERAAKRNFIGSHPRGAPHVGGSKPNVVTGTARRSIRPDRVRKTGPASWSGQVGPTVVYGRRLEMGYPGIPGRGPGYQRTRPFPYLKPAAIGERRRLAALARDKWADAI